MACSSSTHRSGVGGGVGIGVGFLKRSFSESDDNESLDDSRSRTPSQSDDDFSGLSRKKRRGVIEKRRRDRINNCLSELRRLVPQAFDKQGTQKLEKAEILQMTVEHLRFLHSKGIDSLIYDPQRYATDYHSMGFRECASEVARYLSAVEGLDFQNPLRMRLLSHLHCYTSQKLAAAASLSLNWSNSTQYPSSNTNQYTPSNTASSIFPKMPTISGSDSAEFTSHQHQTQHQYNGVGIPTNFGTSNSAFTATAAAAAPSSLIYASNGSSSCSSYVQESLQASISSSTLPPPPLFPVSAFAGFSSSHTTSACKAMTNAANINAAEYATAATSTATTISANQNSGSLQLQIPGTANGNAAGSAYTNSSAMAATLYSAISKRSQAWDY